MSLPPFLIGIGGSSSSGKTTLATLLREVFTGAIDSIPYDTSDPIDGGAETVLLQQDDFFIPRGQAPRTRFRPASPADNYVTRGVPRDDVGFVAAENRDSIEAIRWAEFVDAVYDAKYTRRVNGAIMATAKTLSDLRERSSVGGSFQEAQDMVGRECKRQRELNKKLYREQTRNLQYQGTYFRQGHKPRDDADGLPGDDNHPWVVCNVGIVEGFLLLANAPSPQTKGATATATTTTTQEAQPADDHWAHMAAVERALDVKLFLHTTKPTAAARRFRRRCYTDADTLLGDDDEAACPDRRVPGELWKARGYFDDVAWPEYEACHTRFVNGMIGGAHGTPPPVEGVHVCAEGMSIGDTLLWAVQTILEGLAAREEEWREKWRLGEA